MSVIKGVTVVDFNKLYAGGRSGNGANSPCKGSSVEDRADEIIPESLQRRSWRSYMGYHRKGHFNSEEIITVHPATREDPTDVGQLGTAAIRRSLDVCNPSLTFSVVVRSASSLSGYVTLDIECKDLNTYFVLLRGFQLVQEDAVKKKSEQPQQTISDSLKRKWDDITELWASAQTALRRAEADPADPIAALFQPIRIDAFSSLMADKKDLTARQMLNRARIARMSAKKSSSSASVIDLKASLPPAQFLGWTSAGTQVWARLKMAGLEVKCCFSWDLKRVLFKIRCPQWRLEEVAEHMHMKLKNRFVPSHMDMAHFEMCT